MLSLNSRTACQNASKNIDIKQLKRAVTKFTNAATKRKRKKLLQFSAGRSLSAYFQTTTEVSWKN